MGLIRKEAYLLGSLSFLSFLLLSSAPSPRSRREQSPFSGHLLFDTKST